MIACRESMLKNGPFFLIVFVFFIGTLNLIFDMIGSLLRGQGPGGTSVLYLALILGADIAGWSGVQKIMKTANGVFLDDEKGFLTLRSPSQNLMIPLREVQEIAKVERYGIVGGRFGGGLEKTGYVYEFRVRQGTFPVMDMEGLFDILFYIQQNCPWVKMPKPL